jgi:hypothetical protein
VQTDTDQEVAESNEANNIVGPVEVSQYDLMWLFHEAIAVPPYDTASYYRYNQGYNYWAVTGIRPADISPDTNNWNVRIYEDDTFAGSFTFSETGVDNVEFVVADYNHVPLGIYGIRAYLWYGTGGGGNARIEYEDYNEVQAVPDTSYWAWTQGDVVECYDVYLTGGQLYEFEVDPYIGALDLGMCLVYSGDGDYYQGRQHAEVDVDAMGPGGTESFTYTAPTTDWYGIVVFSNDDEGGEYALSVIELVGLCGDVNGDGSVTSADGYQTLNHIGDPGGFPISSCWAANVNGDGSLTSADGYHLLNYFGDPISFPLNCAPCLTTTNEPAIE